MRGRSDHILLYDILECCDRVAEYIDGVSKQTFENNYQLQDALIRKIEVIGEATKGLSTDITAEDSDIPWKKMAGMRDRMVHQYFRADLDVVWKTVTVFVPQLQSQIQPIYDELSQFHRD